MVIIGGGVSGTIAAFEIRKISKDINITLIEESGFTQFSPCSLPYYLSGEVSKQELILLKEEDYSANNIILKLNQKKIDVDSKKRLVLLNDEQIKYDYLVLATGSKPFVPVSIPGLQEQSFYTLKNPSDAEKLKKEFFLAKKPVIIGGGFIGLEVAGAMKQKCVVIEKNNYLLAGMVDENISLKLESFLESNHVSIIKNTNIEKIEKDRIVMNNQSIAFDKLFLSTGMVPNTDLAKKLNLKTRKGIVVDSHMKTSDSRIYACGDVAESKSFFGGEDIVMLAGVASRQARIIAKHITGKKIFEENEFVGVSVTRVKDLIVGGVGLTELKARDKKLNVFSVTINGSTKPKYFPGGKSLTLKLVCDRKGTLLGAQCIGYEGVAERLNTLTLAITKKCNVRDLAKLETAYNPSISPLHDIINVAAEMCLKRL